MQLISGVSSMNHLAVLTMAVTGVSKVGMVLCHLPLPLTAPGQPEPTQSTQWQ